MGVEFLNEEVNLTRDTVLHPLFYESFIFLFNSPCDMKGDFFMSENRKYLRKIVQTALIVAIITVLGNFDFRIPFGGAAGLKIGLSVFFTKLPALLFGPVYGAVSNGITDVLTFLVKPEGGYLPWLTLTAVLGGFITGFLWKTVKNINVKKMRILFLVIGVFAGIFGLFNQIMTVFFPEQWYSALILGLGKRTWYFTLGFELIFAVLILMLLADLLAKKIMKDKYSDDFIRLLVILLISNIIVTTLNTMILMIFTPALSKLGFVVFYTPRLIEEIITTVIQSFVMSYMLNIYYKYVKIERKENQ